MCQGEGEIRRQLKMTSSRCLVLEETRVRNKWTQDKRQVLENGRHLNTSSDEGKETCREEKLKIQLRRAPMWNKVLTSLQKDMGSTDW